MAVILAAAALLIAPYPAYVVARNVYAQRAGAPDEELVSRNLIDGIVIDAGTEAATRTIGPGIPNTSPKRSVHVSYFVNNVSRDETVSVRQAVKVGDRIPIWVDSAGDISTPPRTAADVRREARVDALLLWSGTAMTVLCGLVVLRWLADNVRYRKWDRALRELHAGTGTRRDSGER